jgi:hypothetical protein
VRGWFQVPVVRPARRTPRTDALEAAAANVVGQTRHTWLSRTGAERYLPDLVAEALREATGADTALVLAAQHLTQGSLDGVTAALRAGPVTELDLMWLFALADDRPATVELRPGELAAAVARHDAIADPDVPEHDRVWWNWSRMPAGVSAGAGEPAATGARAALLRVLERDQPGR